LCVGSPATVADKIVRTSRALGLARFNVKYSAGTLPHAALMQSIELMGREVAPRGRDALSGAPADSMAADS
jgi:alkanesulfonate monooxygenase SsuD/methylene tetrahydromethanopterin reductase-like flavin-dependent oxidoreductase (luciferase family)